MNVGERQNVREYNTQVKEEVVKHSMYYNKLFLLHRSAHAAANNTENPCRARGGWGQGEACSKVTSAILTGSSGEADTAFICVTLGKTFTQAPLS